jgi:hypothetical protein
MRFHNKQTIMVSMNTVAVCLGSHTEHQLHSARKKYGILNVEANATYSGHCALRIHLAVCLYMACLSLKRKLPSLAFSINPLLRKAQVTGSCH